MPKNPFKRILGLNITKSMRSTTNTQIVSSTASCQPQKGQMEEQMQ